jgi:hypothetical protein
LGHTFIGDEAKCKNLHFTLTSHDDFRRSAHPCNNTCTRVKKTCLIKIASAKFCQT